MDLPQPKNLLDLNRVHHELAELFDLHQAALLKRDFNSCRSLWTEYKRHLLVHMREEEELLIPLYAARAAPIRGGGAELFSQEHAKIREWQGRLELRISRLGAGTDAKDLIALLDDEALYKKFIEHHSLREDRILYPELERVVDPKERSGLLRLLTFSLEEDPRAPVQERPP